MHGLAARLHILLVDDDAEQGALVRQALGRVESGGRVTPARRLPAALGTRGRRGTACVVPDLRLPDAQGVGIVRALVAARGGVPVVVVTGAGSEELAVAALKVGAADYVRKHEG